MRNLVLTPLIALLASGGGALMAQDVTTAVLAGRVTSEDGAPLQGVRVLIQSPALLQTRQATTNASGQFRVPLLPNGEYTATYTLNGYVSRKLTLRLIAGQVINGSTSLKSLAVQEETVVITATSGNAQIDKTDTVVQTSFSADYLRQLRSPNSLADLGGLVPGVNKNDASSFRVRGGSQGGVKILTDGQSSMEASGGYFGSTAMVPQDLVESVAVLLSPTNARYGNSDGGIVSMVTSKGSNTFRGTFRVTGLRRGFWSATDRGYPTREGLLNSPPNASDDNLRKNFEYTLSGPIWKDRVTFAYAGKLTPPDDWSESWNKGQWTRRDQGPRPEDPVGLYFKDTNGLVIRRSELGSLQDPFGMMNVNYKEVYNHFSLYAQITQNHQLEYSYRETNDLWGPRSPNNNSASREILPRDYDESPSRFWTMAYKGIIGTSGLLEIRHGYNMTGWLQAGVGTRSHRVYTIPSVVPVSGTYDNNNWVINNYSNNDPSNFRASGYVDFVLNNTTDGYRNHSFGGRDDSGAGAAGGTASTTVNYQHNLNTAMGSHLFDVGLQNDKFDWQHTLNVAEQFYAPGQIPFSLTPQDFYNPNGVSLTQNMIDQNYAGKFIVFNVGAATLGDLDLYGINRYIANNPGTTLTPNTRVYDGVAIGGVASRLSNFFPRVFRRFGEGSDKFYTQMRSFYVNDLWTINDHHSVMLGLRIDNWKLWDRVKEFHSYSQPSLRFDYKLDIHGDQSRLVSVSFAQYHNNNYNAIFSRFASRPQTDSETRYWNAPGPGGTNGPYLVDYNTLTDLKNYGILVSSAREAADTSQIDPDWKAATTDELSVSFARNLSNGGSWKITFVRRVWSNLYDLFPGDIFTNNSGQKQNKMLLKNTDVWERTYTGMEVEWHVPVTKRLTFAGNYTYARLMSNESDTSSGDNLIHSSGGSMTFNLAYHWDKYWPRNLWAPVLQKQSDHNFKFQLIQDLSLGNVKSTVALMGGWQSAGYGTRSFNQTPGYPIIPGVMEANYGGTGQNATNLTATRGIPINMITGADSWYTTMRYNLDMPLVRKLVWFTTVVMDNPFNHRGKQFGNPGSGVNDGNSRIWLVDLYQMNAAGELVLSREKNGPLGPYNGIWRNDGNINGGYRGYMGSRVMSVQTGLRF